MQMARFLSSREPEASLFKWLQQAARAMVEATAQGSSEDHQSEEKPLKASHDQHMYYWEVWCMHPDVSKNPIYLCCCVSFCPP